MAKRKRKRTSSGNAMGYSMAAVVLTALVLFAALAVRVGYSKRVEPDGYNGKLWGADLSEFSGMRYARSVTAQCNEKPKDQIQEPIDAYVEEGADLTYNGMRVQSVQYLFWRNKFAGLLVESKPFEEFSKETFLDAMKTALGKETKRKHDASRGTTYAWEGSNTLSLLVPTDNQWRFSVHSTPLYEARTKIVTGNGRKRMLGDF